MISENTRQKIQKLFTMAERGEGNEAAVALEKARRLMQAYGLIESDVELFVIIIPEKKRKQRWVVTLHDLCGYFCGVASLNGYKKLIFGGDELGVNVARELFFYLKNEVVRKTSEKIIGQKLKNDFRMGVVLGLHERMKECGGWLDMREKRKKTIEKHFSKCEKISPPVRHVDGMYYQAGFDKAKEINLSRQAGYNGSAGALTGGL
jgi:hypothetical protein